MTVTLNDLEKAVECMGYALNNCAARETHALRRSQERLEAAVRELRAFNQEMAYAQLIVRIKEFSISSMTEPKK